MEEQAYSPSYDLVPLPSPPPPLPTVYSTGDTQEDWERETTCWRVKEYEVFEAPKSHDCEKAWSSINHSILSILYQKTEIIYYLQVGTTLMVRFNWGHARPVVWFGWRACAACGLVWPEGMRALWFGLARGHARHVVWFGRRARDGGTANTPGRFFNYLSLEAGQSIQEIERQL